MTTLNQDELRRHEWLAFGLLLGGVVVWAVAAWLRMRRAWVPEYPHAMMGLATVMVFTSLVWRFLAYAQASLHTVAKSERLNRMMAYLACYSASIMIGAGWMIYEQRRLPDVAWMRDRASSVVILYALLVIILPWVVVLAASALKNHRR